MGKINKKKISDLKFDKENINKGSQYGDRLLEKSISEVGMGRSVLTDKNGVLIAGNKTIQKAGEMGFEDVIEIETTGKEIIVVKRMDLDINTAAGAKMKILDNTVSKHNYVEDADIAEAICEEYGIEGQEHGLNSKGEAGEIEEQELKPFKRTHILLSFPPEKMIEIQDLLQKISDFDFIEVEQSSN